ncbi:MAG: hypothetical protein BYD32DRAFT_486570 [Podila humilis]|nr:MAG: hypothetical protein BYD32DRAFT_486570 [Podila humilis]
MCMKWGSHDFFVFLFSFFLSLFHSFTLFFHAHYTPSFLLSSFELNSILRTLTHTRRLSSIHPTLVISASQEHTRPLPMSSSIDSDFHIHTTQSPHTEPDPRVDHPPPDFSQIITDPGTQDPVASISQFGQYILPSSPQSPHTQPDPRVGYPLLDSFQIPTAARTRVRHGSILQSGKYALPSSPQSPHTQPDPRVDNPLLDSSEIPTAARTRDRHGSIPQFKQNTLPSSPQSPHNEPRPRLQPPPIFSIPDAAHSQETRDLDFIPSRISSSLGSL